MRDDSCRHFKSPIHNEACGVGINYRTLAGEPRAGYLARIPCAGSSPIRQGNITCDKMAVFSKEELEQQEKDMKRKTQAIMKAISEIKKFNKAEGGGSARGKIPCPACGNHLSFSIAKLNGHIWGKCDTEGCLNWMM